ncbi:MAG: serine/threonine-protein kinase [Verrucomicrobiales bacterium]|nr:serine/threonine-protein kinase [Verrucomicrobiales bacterium]
MTDPGTDRTHEREKEVFLGVVELESAEERVAWLDQQCGGDEHLRARVEALIQANATGSILKPLSDWSSQSTLPGAGGTWIPPQPGELEKCMPGYSITSLLGRGGMGAVYRGVQQSLDREVAIKLLPPELSANPQFSARFQREAKAMAKLNHPNIVQIYDFGTTTQNHYFFVMEFVDGCDLQTYARSGKLTAADALIAVGQICGALQYAHDKGFVHRDIKPANIFLRNDGVVKVGDFGLAKLMAVGDPETEDCDISNLTMSGCAVGTLNYIAPEQLEGERNVDHRADLYSLGVMFYEMLTGELPRGAVKPPSQKIENLDVRIDDVVFRAMESKPENRYQSATDLHLDVEKIRSNSGIAEATDEGEEERPAEVTRPKKSKKWFWIVSTVVELALVTGFFVLPLLEKNPPPTVPGALHSFGKMAVGSKGALVPVDIRQAEGVTDLVQLAGKYRGAWAGLRKDGSVISSSAFDLRTQSGIMRFGQRSGTSGNLFYISKSGKIISANPEASAGLIPDVSTRVSDLATHNNHGLILYRNGRVIPFGKDYQERSRFRPALAALTGVTDIAVGERTSVILKKDGSVLAWSREGYIVLPDVFSADIVSIAVSTTPGIIGLNRSGKVFSAFGGKITSTGTAKDQAVIGIAGGDNIYSPPMYQTADGEWHLFEESKLRAVHPEAVAAISRLKGLPPEAFHLRLDSNASSEAYLLWIR